VPQGSSNATCSPGIVRVVFDGPAQKMAFPEIGGIAALIDHTQRRRYWKLPFRLKATGAQRR
jgi:hypothetical protein